MQTFELLGDPDFRQLYVYALLAGLAVVLMCAVLSVLVVVKRLGFVGQGISHSAFGGIGVAAVLGALGIIAPGGVLEWGVITIFCLVTALAMALVSDRRTLPVDTAIGLALVASMAVGAILVDASRGIAISMGNPVSGRSWESILFGSILVAGPVEIIGGWVVCVIVVGTAWVLRRPMIFWALDEDSARAFGVPGSMMKLVLLALLAMAVVTAMKLVGVVLATALLVLPGATALRLSDRLWPSIAIAIATSVVALIMGLFASLEFDWQTGPSIVLTMVVLLGVCEAVARLRGGKATKAIAADAA